MKLFGVGAVLDNTVPGGGGHQQRYAQRSEQQTGEMDQFMGAGQAIEIAEQHSDELESEQGLSAGQHHAGFREHVLDFAFEISWAVIGVAGIGLFAGTAPSTAMPGEESEGGSSHGDDYAAPGAEQFPGSDIESDPHGSANDRQRWLDDGVDEFQQVRRIV